MGPLLVGAAGLMLGRVAVAGPGPGGGRGAVAPAAWGDCGAVTAAAALSRLLPGATLGSIGVVCTIRGIMFAKF